MLAADVDVHTKSMSAETLRRLLPLKDKSPRNAATNPKAKLPAQLHQLTKPSIDCAISAFMFSPSLIFCILNDATMGDTPGMFLSSSGAVEV